MKQKILDYLMKILKEIAKLTVKKYKPLIIGVTGNVGKTSTKEMIALFLKQEKKIWFSSKSFNNELGLPLAIIGDFKEIKGKFFWLGVILKGIFQLLFYNKNYPEILVLEYGVDKPLDMNYLLNIAKPSIGIFTQTGEIPVHVEFFQDKEGIFKEEAKLIYHLPATGLAVLNADNKEIFNLKKEIKANVLSYGFNSEADIKIFNFKSELVNNKFITSFKINYQGKIIPFKIENVVGKNVAYCIASTIAVGLYLNINILKINNVLKEYQPPPGRLRILKGLNDALIIDDSYNASPQAVLNSLEVLNFVKNRKKILVLGDMLELGKYSYEAHKMIGEKLKKVVDIVVLVGFKTEITYESAILNGFEKRNIFYFKPPLDYQKIADFVKNFLDKNSVILVKGSQGLRLEKIIKEIIIDKEKAKELLVRQNKAWLLKKGIYEK